MPAITTNDLKTGMHLEVEGNLVQVVDFQHVKPGKGHAFVRTTLKNARNGAVVEKTFRAGEKVERVTVDKREMQYLYNDGTDFVFMDNSTYDQINVSATTLGDAANYLVEGSTAVLQMFGTEIVGVDLPAVGRAGHHRDRARHPGRPGLRRPQAGHAGDRPHRAGPALHRAG